MPYEALKAIIDSNRVQAAQYAALPPDACPNDGTPLEIGWKTMPGGGKEMQRNCPMGDYTYTAGPRLI